MKSLFQLFKYVLPFKFILIIAMLFSLLFSLFNGLTLYSVVPIFDTMTGDADISGFVISEKDKELVQRKKLNINERIKVIQIKIKRKINSYFFSKTRVEIITTISLMIFPLLILKNLFDFIARSLFSYAGNRVIQRIRNSMFAHMIRLPYTYFHKSRSGELLSRVTKDVLPFNQALSSEIYNFFSGFILFVINLIIIFFISWKLFFLILIMIFPLIGPVRFLGNQVKKYTGKVQEGFSDISSKLEETITGIKVIKSFNMEGFETKRFQQINSSILFRELKRRIFQNLNPSVVEMLGSIVAIVIFIYGGYQIINGEITSGEFIFFILLTVNLIDPVKRIANSINSAKAAEAASNRIFEILKLPIEDFDTGIEGNFIQSIEFNDMSIKYNDDFALKNINITIPKGKTVAIVGASGSGKSTLLNIIAALYSNIEGEIFIDNFNMRDLSLKWIRKEIAFVTQEVFLFNGTILENITCGQNYEMERIIEASKISHAHEFISKLPDGYNTEIGERGMTLSGGERQRITIARAVLNNPEILLFDEATSALDSESEKLIQDSLKYLFKSRTSLIVSHKLSTVKDADIIYLIEKGYVVDSGKHAELISRSEDYRRLLSD